MTSIPGLVKRFVVSIQTWTEARIDLLLSAYHIMLLQERFRYNHTSVAKFWSIYIVLYLSSVQAASSNALMISAKLHFTLVRISMLTI